MRVRYYFLLLLLSYSGFGAAQTADYSNFRSIFIPPPGYIDNQTDAVFDPVTIDGFDNFYLGNDFGEPHIVTNPRDPLNSICAFNTNSLYVTINGIDWTKIPVAFPGYSVLGDPVLSFDSLGNAFYVQLYQNGSTYGVVTARSTNKGLTWPGVYNVASTTVGLSDKEWIAADQTAGPNSNNLYIVWRQFGSSNMRFVRSTNSGVNWSSPFTYSGSQGAYVAVGPNGAIQGGSVYSASLSGSSILVNRSTDGGATFGPQVSATSFSPGGVFCINFNTVKDCIRTNGFPRVAADNSYGPNRGTVYVVYEMNPAGADLFDINLVKSTDFGATWSAPVRVNDDATTTDQWLPALSVDNKTGKVFISWFDSREDAGNLMTKVYGTVSTNGGATFTANEPISNQAFNPNLIRVGQPGGAFYIGDYFGISAIENTSYAVWMDGRTPPSLGSYTGYYPDYAMTASKTSAFVGMNDSTTVTVKVPAIKGPFSDRVKFTATVDSLPPSGTISLSFLNGKDSITAFPDSVTLKIKTSNPITPGRYKISVTGRGRNGTPAHRRSVFVYVNSSLVKVQTNRGALVPFKINGSTYTGPQELVFVNGSNVLLEAPPSVESGSNRFVFSNWSNGGSATQTINVTNSIDLTATYKIQYKVLLISNPPSANIFGNTFQDSAVNFKFGVSYNRIIINQDSTYWFRGWNGGGIGSYTSPDSLGLDDTVEVSIKNPIVQTIRWSLNNPSPVGIAPISSEIPERYKLYQNYPNPFNPETSIKFDLVRQGNVKIALYDVLGKEVDVLVNEVQKAGRYEVKYNASHLASGVYYYKITTSDYSEIKKMLLIK